MEKKKKRTAVAVVVVAAEEDDPISVVCKDEKRLPDSTLQPVYSIAYYNWMSLFSLSLSSLGLLIQLVHMHGNGRERDNRGQPTRTHTHTYMYIYLGMVYTLRLLYILLLQIVQAMYGRSRACWLHQELHRESLGYCYRCYVQPRIFFWGGGSKGARKREWDPSQQALQKSRERIVGVEAKETVVV